MSTLKDDSNAPPTNNLYSTRTHIPVTRHKHTPSLEAGVPPPERPGISSYFPTIIPSLIEPDPESRRDSNGSARTLVVEPRNDYRRRRTYSTFSDGNGEVGLDPDDPAITGVRPKRRSSSPPITFDTGSADEEAEKEKRRKRRMDEPEDSDEVARNISTLEERQRFIRLLAKALILFGAPSHRIEGMLISTSKMLRLPAEFINLGSIIFVTFGDLDLNTAKTYSIKSPGSLDLGKVHQVHGVYREVVHDEISAERGSEKLRQIMSSKPLYGVFARCLFAFGCALSIGPIAFESSFVDMWMGAIASSSLVLVQTIFAGKNPILANIFEVVAAICVSFYARGLSTVPNNLFCYQAISSSGVVLILPGFSVLNSALELLTRHTIPGSARLIMTIVYTLFLSFGLTIGSDLYFAVDRRARRVEEEFFANISSIISFKGNFTASTNSEGSTYPYTSLTGTFTFTNATVDPNMISGCRRDPSFPWYKASLPFWTLFIFVPAFSTFISLHNQQPIRSRNFIVMIVISCTSFAANKAATYFIFNRGDVVSTVGAFVVGVMGHLYSRLLGGTAFTAVVTGVLFLVPSGLSAAGGLADPYRSTGSDYFLSSLTVGARMVQVGITISIGLQMAGLLVYMFGRRKRAAIFAF